MTPKQIELMRRCIRAVRTSYMAEAASRTKADWELVEVGWISGVDPRTAKSLVDAGLLEYEQPSWANVQTGSHVRLPTESELQEERASE